MTDLTPDVHSACTEWLDGYHQALEDAAAECDRHAQFCRDEANKGGG